MNPGRPGSYFFYGSFITPDLDLITDNERTAPENKNAGKEVLQNILECKADRNRRNSESCNQVSRIESRKDNYSGNKQTENNRKRGGQTAEQIGERSIKPRSAARGIQNTLYQARTYEKENKYYGTQYQIRQMGHQPVEELAENVPNNVGIERPRRRCLLKTQKHEHVRHCVRSK